MNFKTLVAPVAAITLAIAGVVSTPQAKADYYNTQRIGNQTYTYGSGGSSLNTNRIETKPFTTVAPATAATTPAHAKPSVTKLGATDHTWFERGHPVEVPETELRRTVGSLPGDAHRA